MKSTALALFMMLPFLSFAKKDHNYKYTFNASCKCIINKDNPKGIEQVTIASYENDPAVHSIVGYYHGTSATRVDTFSVVDYSPKSFSYYPFAFNFEANKKYVFMLPGKPDMDQVEILLTKDDKGVIKQLKNKSK
jgi:hypothetical protein